MNRLVIIIGILTSLMGCQGPEPIFEGDNEYLPYGVYHILLEDRSTPVILIKEDTIITLNPGTIYTLDTIWINPPVHKEVEILVKEEGSIHLLLTFMGVITGSTCFTALNKDNSKIIPLKEGRIELFYSPYY